MNKKFQWFCLKIASPNECFGANTHEPNDSSSELEVMESEE